MSNISQEDFHARFSFKQFEVQHSSATMKVGTDAVLLGSWVDLSFSQRILDIGTGCGILALMAAQRSNAIVDAIDVHAPSVNEASGNFERSPWPDRLCAYEESVQHWSPEHPYDHILVNPPYFNAQLKSPSPGKTLARHAISLNPDILARHSKRLLDIKGKLSLVLQSKYSKSFITAFSENGLKPERKLLVSSHQGKPPVLSLHTLSLRPTSSLIEEELFLYDKTGNRSEGYADLTQEFYL